jgi:A/G-specific adenine glycosylase
LTFSAIDIYDSTGVALVKTTRRFQISKEIAGTLMAWFDANRREMPWRGETDPYKIWISEVMLQQTQVKTVIPYFERWMSFCPNVKALADAGIEDILRLWEGLGYYSRARHAHRAAQTILTRFEGAFPMKYSDILDLPGVGPYVAAAVASIAFNQPVGVADGNVIRVISRLFALAGDSTKRSFRIETARIVESGFHDYEPRWVNQAWMEFGALRCIKSPACASCVLRKFCVAELSNRVECFPVKPAKKKIPTRHGAAFVICREGAVLMVKRPSEGLLGGLWELPNVMFDRQTFDDFVGTCGLESCEHLPESAQHHYSHFKVHFALYRANLRDEWSHPFWPEHSWIPVKQLQKIAKPKVHVKALILAGILDNCESRYLNNSVRFCRK